MKQKIVVFIDGENPGDFNMTRDLFLFNKAINEKNGIIYIRLYSFNPKTLSLGVFQKIDPAIEKRARELKFDIVRRPTGGRAVIHEHELTYSIIFSWKNSIFSGNIRKSYYKISRIWEKALKTIGLDVEIANLKNTNYAKHENCFTSPSYFELLWQNEKIMGSAQKREREFCLQHGSLLLKRDPNTYKKIFNINVKGFELGLSRDKIIQSFLKTLSELPNITIDIKINN